MSADISTEAEAAAFRRLVSHLQKRTDVQNVDLMILADFCRNCLSDWLREETEARGGALTKDAARAQVYGMPYAEWKAAHQKPMTPEQEAAFAARRTAPDPGAPTAGEPGASPDSGG